MAQAATGTEAEAKPKVSRSDRIGELSGWLTRYHEPTAKYADLPAELDSPGGTCLGWGAEWADRLLTAHCHNSTAA